MFNIIVLFNKRLYLLKIFANSFSAMICLKVIIDININKI